MTQFTPTSLICSNCEDSSGLIVPNQPANDFFCRFKSQIHIKENTQIALKSIQFEPTNTISVIEDINDRFSIYVSGGGAPTFGLPIIPATLPNIQITAGEYTIETFCEEITNEVNATAPATWTDYFGFRCYFSAKGYIFFEFTRLDSANYNIPATIQIGNTNSLGFSRVIGLADQIHELTNITGAVHNIIMDYQPYYNVAGSTAGGTINTCCLVDIQNLRFKSMNSYIKNNCNIIAKVPIYSVPMESYVNYEPATPIFFKTQETIITELHFRLLSLDMSLMPCSNYKPTIVVLEIIPPE